jgi:hypothetical protein
MGGGASVEDKGGGPTQAELDAAVGRVLDSAFDRVHVRAHYAKVLSDKPIDARLSFKVTSGNSGDTPVLPEILTTTPAQSPPHEASFFARYTSSNPTWNQEELLLYQRESSRTCSADAADAMDTVPNRLLEVHLQDVQDTKARLLDQVTSMAESTQKFFLRNIERFMTDPDRRHSPLVDMASEDIDEKTPSSVETVNDRHKVRLPAPSEGWVFHKLEGAHAVTYISIKTSRAEVAISSAEDLRLIGERMTEVPLENLSHGNKALLRHLQRPSNDRALLWIPGFNDSFHNHIFAEEMLQEGYDVWILDLRRCGACRRAFPGDSTGPLDYHRAADLREYFEEIERSLELMKRRAAPYRDIVGYAHSSGGIVMLDYALEFTDSQFSGFIFNSPFLDWGYAAGQLINHNSPKDDKTGECLTFY